MHPNFCKIPVRRTTSRTRKSYKRHRNLKRARINNKHNLVKSANLIAINPTKNGPPAPKIIPKCMVINTRSLAKPQAASALSIELSAWEIDICFVCETWLNNTIPSSLICPNNYSIVRKDRDQGRR